MQLSAEDGLPLGEMSFVGHGSWIGGGCGDEARQRQDCRVAQFSRLQRNFSWDAAEAPKGRFYSRFEWDATTALAAGPAGAAASTLLASMARSDGGSMYVYFLIHVPSADGDQAQRPQGGKLPRKVPECPRNTPGILPE